MQPSRLVPAQPAVPALPDFDAAQADVMALGEVLAQEFEALRTQSFDTLESLQDRKIALLESLERTARQVALLDPKPPQWADVVESLARCREPLMRNEHLVARQLEVVRNALRSLQAADPTASVDLYDRLGQMARRGGARAWLEA